MNTMLIAAVVAITMALLFYTIGVWWERLERELAGRHLVFFCLGLLCDIAGTGCGLSGAVHGGCRGNNAARGMQSGCEHAPHRHGIFRRKFPRDGLHSRYKPERKSSAQQRRHRRSGYGKNRIFKVRVIL